MSYVFLDYMEIDLIQLTAHLLISTSLLLADYSVMPIIMARSLSYRS